MSIIYSPHINNWYDKRILSILKFLVSTKLVVNILNRNDQELNKYYLFLVAIIRHERINNLSNV